MKRISGGQTSLGADCHAPIRSRRRSSGGGERQELSQSDQPVDRDFESQPAASPRTNRTSRTSPPGRLRDDDSDGTFRSVVRHGPTREAPTPVFRTKLLATPTCVSASAQAVRAAAWFYNTYFRVFFANCEDFCRADVPKRSSCWLILPITTYSAAQARHPAMGRLRDLESGGPRGCDARAVASGGQTVNV